MCLGNDVLYRTNRFLISWNPLQCKIKKICIAAFCTQYETNNKITLEIVVNFRKCFIFLFSIILVSKIYIGRVRVIFRGFAYLQSSAGPIGAQTPVIIPVNTYLGFRGRIKYFGKCKKVKTKRLIEPAYLRRTWFIWAKISTVLNRDEPQRRVSEMETCLFTFDPSIFF